MTVRLKYVRPWPISIAAEDLKTSISLFYYARYGLDMRMALEINGPYEFAARDTQYMNAMGLAYTKQGDEITPLFDEHRHRVSQAASYQHVLNCYSIFEFLIANLVVFIYLGCKDSEPNSRFKFIWHPSNRARFLSDERITDIEEDKWMKRHYRDRHVMSRVALLDDVCELGIRDFALGGEGDRLTWQEFRSQRSLRHSIAHTSGRATV